jgi:8-amino-7-oxononanoate synthase
MQNSFLQKLAERHQKSLLRELMLPQGEDFCSNDYLGFAQDAVLQKRVQERIKDLPSGSAGSRLLRGHQDIFMELEAELARFSERESALIFSTGYQANIGLLSAILDRNSIVFSDELNHASLIDGIRLSGAHKRIFSHNSLASLEEQLIAEETSTAHKLIIVESLYSMTGDRAPLKEIISLAQRYGAEVVVDEAHATGVYGAGLTQKLDLHHQCLATIHSGAKALGVAGSWIACDRVLKDFFINFSRPFIYSTAPSPLVAGALLASLEHWHNVGRDRGELCLDKARNFADILSEMIGEGLEEGGLSLVGDGPILYLQVGDSAKALTWSGELRSSGFDIRAIRYPTVAEDQAGLRISIHTNHSDSTLDRLLQIFKNMVRPC